MYERCCEEQAHYVLTGCGRLVNFGLIWRMTQSCLTVPLAIPLPWLGDAVAVLTRCPAPHPHLYRGCRMPPRLRRRYRHGKVRSGGWRATRARGSAPRRPCRWGRFSASSSAMGCCEFVSGFSRIEKRGVDLHALGVELVTAGQAHHTTNTIHIFFKTHDALDLPPHVFFPFAGQLSGGLLVVGPRRRPRKRRANSQESVALRNSRCCPRSGPRS